jgi:osmoprotectant transport system substrate-binding protein
VVNRPLSALATLLAAFIITACSNEQRPIVVGSKNLTESVILGELLAQKLESIGCGVDRRLNMGGTLVADSAIQSGAIDTYVEYSGTALAAILKRPTMNDRAAVNALVSAAYQQRGLRWSPPLGFDNTFAMIVRKADAERYGLRTISDLTRIAKSIRPGFGYEFTERSDGWTGLQKAYDLHVDTAPRSMDLGLMYKALTSKQVDLIAGAVTDGLIEPLGLVILADDRHYFPPYDAVVVQRTDIDQRCKGASAALESLRGTLDDATMRRLNHEVDGRKRDVGEVVRELLARKR